MFDVLVGIMLGDGYMARPNAGGSPRLRIRHSVKDAPYMEHLMERLKSICAPAGITREKNGGWGGDMLCLCTRCLPELEELFTANYQNGRRVVPAQIGDWLTPEGMAYWLMDDGSSHESTLSLSTNRYAKADCQRLRAVLKDYGITTRLQHEKAKDLWSIRMGRQAAETFSALVRPYVIPSMRYKLVMPPKDVPCAICRTMMRPAGGRGVSLCSNACRQQRKAECGRQHYKANREKYIANAARQREALMADPLRHAERNQRRRELRASKK